MLDFFLILLRSLTSMEISQFLRDRISGGICLEYNREEPGNYPNFGEEIAKGVKSGFIPPFCLTEGQI